MPFFSIIIPMYNAGKTIRAALKSIAAQSFKDYEVLAIDDGSTDNTVTEALNAGITVHLLRNARNLGAGPTRQRGIDEALGDYLLFLDADDELSDREVFARFSKIIVETNYPDLVRSRFAEVGTGYRTERDTTQMGSMSGNAYKREYILKTGVRIQPFKLCEDTIFNYMLIQSYPKNVFLDYCTFNYNIRKESTTGQRDYRKEALEWLIRGYTYMFEHFKDKNINNAYTITTRFVAYGYYYYFGLLQDKRLTLQDEALIISLFKEFEEKTGTLKLLETHKAFCDFLIEILGEERKAALLYVPKFLEVQTMVDFYSEILGRPWVPYCAKREAV